MRAQMVRTIDGLSRRPICSCKTDRRKMTSFMPPITIARNVSPLNGLQIA